MGAVRIPRETQLLSLLPSLTSASWPSKKSETLLLAEAADGVTAADESVEEEVVVAGGVMI